MPVEVLPQLTFEDMRGELARLRGSMPTRTLYYQISQMGIIPTSKGYYTYEDLETLKALNQYLQAPNGTSINKFKRALALGV